MHRLLDCNILASNIKIRRHQWGIQSWKVESDVKKSFIFDRSTYSILSVQQWTVTAHRLKAEGRSNDWYDGLNHTTTCLRCSTFHLVVWNLIDVSSHIASHASTLGLFARPECVLRDWVPRSSLQPITAWLSTDRSVNHAAKTTR